MSRGQHSRGQHRQVPDRATRALWSILKGMVVMPLVFILASGVAEAYWSAGSGAGGNGASTATAVNQGATPTVSAAGQVVTVSWAARTLSNGTAVAGYIVKRYTSGTLILQTILSACTGTVAATTCTENTVPEGQWVYSVTPVFATNWRGAESLKSSTVTVDVTAPVNSISLSGVSGNAVKSGNTIYYRGSAPGSFTLTNAVTDSGSGPASSATATLGGTTTGWTHSPSTVSAPAGGPYVSTMFSWAASTTSSPTEVVTGKDVSNNSAATTLTFTDDSAGPTGGSVDAGGLVGTGSRYSTSPTTLSINFAKGTDALSGVATAGATLRRATSALSSTGTLDGTCAAFVAYTTVTGGTDPVSPKSDTVTDQACYSYQYIVVDVLGNSTTYTSPGIKVDSTAPAAPSLTFGTFTNTYWASGSTIYYRGAAASGSFTATAIATDNKSGIFSYAFPALGTNWTSTPGASGVNTYSWSGAEAIPGTKSVTATNNATGTSAATSFTPTADDTAPSAGTLSYFNGTQSGTTISVTFAAGTDAGSGVGTRLLQRASATLTGSTCGSYGAFGTVLNGTNPTSPLVDTVTAGNCYKYQYVVPDNVGNTDTASSASVVKVTTLSCGSPGVQPALIATSDSWVDQNAQSATHGGEASMWVQSQDGNRNRRSLVQFTLTALPANCTVTSATLRMYKVATATDPRTIEVFRANAAWNETAVNWTNQPAQTGTAVTSPATNVAGWQTWTVTAHVQAQDTTNHGFIVKDANEDNPNWAPSQNYNGRTNASNRPELVVTWG